MANLLQVSAKAYANAAGNINAILSEPDINKK